MAGLTRQRHTVTLGPESSPDPTTWRTELNLPLPG
jgi:hypothetical protein